MGLFNFRSTPKDRVIGILNTSSEIIFDNGFKDVVSGAKLNVQTVKISPFLFIFHHLTYIRKSLYYSAF